MRGRRPFRDTEDSGQRLAERLAGYWDKDPIALALPRDGVPVGYEISRSLGGPLDVFVVRKLGGPWREELGIGAGAQGGVRVLNEYAAEVLVIPGDHVERVAKKETAEIEKHLGALARRRTHRDQRAERALTGSTESRGAV